MGKSAVRFKSVNFNKVGNDSNCPLKNTPVSQIVHRLQDKRIHDSSVNVSKQTMDRTLVDSSISHVLKRPILYKYVLLLSLFIIIIIIIINISSLLCLPELFK